MMNLVQKIIISLVGLGILSFILIWYLTKSVSTELIREIFNKELFQLGSVHSEIEGDIRWQIFPRPGVRINNVKLENNITQPHYSLLIEDVVLNLQFAPLLRGKLVFNDLHVDDFTLTLNLNGHNETPHPIVTKASKPATYKTKKIPQFAIANLLLTHGQITILHGKQQVVLSGLQMGATQLNWNNNYFPIIVKGNILASVPDNHVSGSFHFKGRTHIKDLLTDPIKFLSERGIEGQLAVKNLRFKNVAIDSLNTTLLSTPDELILNPLNISIYGGNAVGDLSYNFPAQKLTINQTATDVNTEDLLPDLLGVQLIKGLLDFSLHASVKFQDNNWKDDIQGNGSITIRNGVLYGVNLNKLASDITQKVHSLFVNNELDLKLALNTEAFKPISYERGKTDFELLSIQYRLHNSIFLNDTLLLQTPNMKIQGSGHVNLNDFTVDNSIEAKVHTRDPFLEKLQEFFNGNLPLRLTGKLNNPVLLADAEKINPMLSKVLLEKTLQKPIKDLQQTLKNFLSDFS